MSKRKLLLLLIVFLVLGYFARPWIDQLIPGQTKQTSTPELGDIYNRSAQYDDGIRNPVIVVPGMMGSRLQQLSKSRTVWGAFDNMSIDSDNAADVRLLACPLLADTDLGNFRDGVGATGVLDTLKINIAGLALSHKAYLNILRMLGIGGYRDEELGLAGAVNYGQRHFTCFQFPYDWRCDNADNAKRFHKFLLEKKDYVEEQRLKRFGVATPCLLYTSPSPRD